MICPRCKADTQVVDTRPLTDGSIYRRRRCGSCKTSFVTCEKPVAADVKLAPRIYAAPTLEERERLNARKRRERQARQRKPGRPEKPETKERLRARQRTNRKVSEAARILGVSTAEVRRQWGLKPGDVL